MTIDYGTQNPKKITETLEAGKSLIVGYDTTLLTSNLSFIPMTFKLINNGTVNIKLKLKDKILDSFSLSKDALSKIDKKISFEKNKEN